MLQIIDVLYIKYESQEYSQCTYLTIGWRQREREDMSVLLEESGGCVISTLQETNPEKIYDGTRKLKPKI